jgi:hypothetical protein
MNIPENILNTLTDEQKKQLEAAQTPRELLALARDCGRELTLEQLEAVSGGLAPRWDPGCPEDEE